MAKKLTSKALRAFHADRDSKRRCYGCGRRVEPVPYREPIDNGLYIEGYQDGYICPFCGEEIEPFGKWDKAEGEA